MKPIVFFSHSSNDKLLLNKLKESILFKTNNAIEIFLSSDGQSIPFGKNWIYSIEKALHDTSLMFVFLSPNSIHSNWIYFESGYSYSKDIEVVPIGILGVDLNQIKPPLNLLQGFNITSHDGLNNLIKTINAKFKLSCPLNYSADDYSSLLIDSELSNYSSEDLVLNTVDLIRTSFPSELKSDKEEIRSISGQREKICNYFKENGIAYRETQSEIESYGLQFLRDPKNQSLIRESYKLFIDPTSVTRNISHIVNIVNILYNEELKHFWLHIIFKEDYEIISQDFKISSRLHLPEIELISDPDVGKAFRYENIIFAFDDYLPEFHGKLPFKPEKILRVVFRPQKNEALPISKLINLLYVQGVIFEKK